MGPPRSLHGGGGAAVPSDDNVLSSSRTLRGIRSGTSHCSFSLSLAKPTTLSLFLIHFPCGPLWGLGAFGRCVHAVGKQGTASSHPLTCLFCSMGDQCPKEGTRRRGRKRGKVPVNQGLGDIYLALCGAGVGCHNWGGTVTGT